MRLTFPTLAAIFVVIVIPAIAYFVSIQDQDPSTNFPDTETPANRAIDRTPVNTTYNKDRFAPANITTAEPIRQIEAPAPNLIPAPLELTDSDKQVIKALQHLSPTMTQWLIPSEQVRKWVLAIDIIADGRLPKRYRPIDYPMKKFTVEKQGDITVISQQNFSRVTPLLEALTSIDVKLLAEYYRTWKPLLEKAYREQGKSGTFDDRFTAALNQIIAVDPLSDNEALIRPSVLYRYRNDLLEQASDVEKFFWRLGPDNTLSLQAFVRSLRHEIAPH